MEEEMPAFNSLRKKLRRRRIETMLLAGYAFAITCALMISLVKTSNDKPQLPIYHSKDDTYDFSSDILTPAFSDSSQDNPFELVYMQVNEIKLLSDNEIIAQKFEMSQAEKNVVMPVDAKPKMNKEYTSISGIYQKERRVLVVKSGDTFIGMLTGLGMDTKSATEAYNVLRKVYDARNLRVGQYMELTATFDVRSRQLETLDTLTIEPQRGSKYILRMNEYDKYEAKAEYEKFAHDIKVAQGKVSSSVSASLISAGVPRSMAAEIINRMSHQINFRTDIHKGDSFTVKYDVSKTAEGEVVKVGSLLYASFTTKGHTYKLYRFNDNYYDEKGQSKKSGLDIKPLAMRNARISSLFGYRRHPIYKTSKFHSGVDYAAPKGTPIYASGNGTIEMAQYVNGYGNFIKIRHNSEYETAYGHMQRFASGMRPGVKVKKGQVIGYVGSTGQSTGPHLHFEILKRGQRINPLKSKVATGNDLYGGQLTEFKRRMRQIDGAVEQITKTEAAQQKSEKVLWQTADILTGKIQEQQVADEQNVEVSDEQNVVSNEVIDAAAIVNTDADKPVEPVSEIEVADTKVVDDRSENSQSVEASSDDAESKMEYKGKVIYPPTNSAMYVRQKYAGSGKLPKIVKVPSRKPKYARR